MKCLWLCLLCVGCASTPKVPDWVPSDTQQVEVRVDPKLLVECPEIPDAVIPDVPSILVAKGSDKKLYDDCRNRVRGLIEVLKRMVKEKPNE